MRIATRGTFHCDSSFVVGGVLKRGPDGAAVPRPIGLRSGAWHGMRFGTGGSLRVRGAREGQRPRRRPRVYKSGNDLADEYAKQASEFSRLSHDARIAIQQKANMLCDYATWVARVGPALAPSDSVRATDDQRKKASKSRELPLIVLPPEPPAAPSGAQEC